MDKHELISNTFSSLEKELIAEINAVSTLREIRAGMSLPGEGDHIISFPMILTGCLRVVRLSDEGNELLLYYLNSGDMCSMSLACCIIPRKRNIKMIAEEDTVLITIPVNMPDKWMSGYKSWKEFMMNSYRIRFDELLDTIDSISFMKLDDRLIRFFEERYKSTGSTLFNGTHKDIADQLNTSREVITRLLRNLEIKKLVRTERNYVDYTGLTGKSSR